MNILSIEEISKSFGVRPLFEGVTFGLEEGEKVGIIGANGSGKSTLLRIIASREQPDAGRVVTAGERRVVYLPQNPEFPDEQTVLDAVFTADSRITKLIHDYEAACHDLALGGGADEKLLDRVSTLANQMEAEGAWEMETNAKTVLTRLGIRDTSATIGRLSGGERKRVALAHALVGRHDLLLLDEPTNHLDADTIAWLEAYLARYAGALLLVTHDRYFLDRVTRRIIEIDNARVQSFAGNYGYYLEKKAEQEAQHARESEKRDALLRRELAWLKRGAKARTTKQKARVERAEELINQPARARKSELDISVAFSRMGKKILELHNVSKSYDGKKLIGNFNYSLKRGDRIGVIGPNGSGKTTLLDIIAGRVAPDRGRVEKGQTIVIGYYDQQARELSPEQRVIDYIRETAEQVETADGSIITASQMLEKFLFPRAAQYDWIGRLSGGERRRLYLLSVLMSAPNVLLLDEPTNDLDIQTLMRLEDYLDSFAGCLIIVSHDRYLLDRTVEHVFSFEGDGRVAEYPGNYSAFLQARERDRAHEREASLASEAARKKAETAAAKAADKPRKLSYKEQRELQELESRIEAAEARKSEIESQLAAPSSDYVLVQALYTELEALKQQLDRDVERWAELAEMA